MAINNHSNITSETRFKDTWVDAQKFTEAKAALEHSSAPQSTRPWGSTYVPEDDESLSQLYVKNGKIDADPAVQDANNNDLKIRNLNHS